MLATLHDLSRDGKIEAAADGDERGYLRLMLERRVDGLVLARPVATRG